MAADYLNGFGGHFESRSGRGRASPGPQQPAAAGLRPLCRASFRHRLHRAAPRQPAKLAVPAAADRRPPAVRALCRRRAVRCAGRRSAACAQPAALGSARRPARRHRFRRRPGDHAAGARARGSRRLRGPCLPREPEHGAAGAGRRRRRAADHPAAGRACASTPSLAGSTSRRDRSRWSRAGSSSGSS